MVFKIVATLAVSSALVLGATKSNFLQQALAATDEHGGSAYITAPVSRGSITTTLSATGRLSALVTVSVGSQLSGQVAKLLADFNDTVEQGQVLAELDPRSLDARAREAEAALQVARLRVEAARSARERAAIEVAGVRGQLAEADAALERAQVVADGAERDHERSRNLQTTMSQAAIENSRTSSLSAAADLRAAAARRRVAQQRLLAAESEARAAAAEIRHAEAVVDQQSAILEQARIDLDRSVIRSPIAGVVISRDVNVGQTVAASLEAPTLFTIAQDLSDMQVVASVDEADISRVRIGQSAAFTVDAYPDLTFRAVVSDIHKAPRITQNVVAYTVILTAKNPELALLPGMTASVRLITESASDVLKIPMAALYFWPDGTGQARPTSAPDQTFTIWLARERGAPVPREVRVGRSDGASVEVLADGVEVGQEIVVGTSSNPETPSLLSRILGS